MTILNNSSLAVFLEKVANQTIYAEATPFFNKVNLNPGQAVNPATFALPAPAVFDQKIRYGRNAEERLRNARQRDTKFAAQQAESNPFANAKNTRPGTASFRNPSSMAAARRLGLMKRFGSGLLGGAKFVGRGALATAGLVGLAGIAGAAAASKGSPYEMQ